MSAWWHLTLVGKAEAIWYHLRRLVLDPAPAEDRCIMGYPIGELIRCPRRALGDGLWCSRHQP